MLTGIVQTKFVTKPIACPQIQFFNGGIWSTWKNIFRSLVKSDSYVSVDMIIGLFFLSDDNFEEDGKRYAKCQVIGNNNVAVPTHFFKIIHADSTSSVETYILPKIASKDEDFHSYLKSLGELEKV